MFLRNYWFWYDAFWVLNSIKRTFTPTAKDISKLQRLSTGTSVRALASRAVVSGLTKRSNRTLNAVPNIEITGVRNTGVTVTVNGVTVCIKVQP
jgi:hypothetical protein